ncbi:hypothetical protein BD311DRAFT_187856 [Dichomitus squalens]|uniref:Secreted protein n=1 Tax=Dichomitus squalens TaxID=114155 RepID=A0A4Q9MU57_9APHY|nr:hypothetical protein BD311DRAFT_187856 [Dichomitus squalens]
MSRFHIQVLAVLIPNVSLACERQRPWMPLPQCMARLRACRWDIPGKPRNYTHTSNNITPLYQSSSVSCDSSALTLSFRLRERSAVTISRKISRGTLRGLLGHELQDGVLLHPACNVP